MRKVNSRKIAEFTRRFNEGAYGDQRYGQAFCNEFDYTGPGHAELFYESSRIKAAQMIWDSYWDHMGD